jgi:hypothetical protein
MQRKRNRPHRILGPIFPSKVRGVCPLCDEYMELGVMIGRVPRFGWVHVDCAAAGNIPPTKNGTCGAFTQRGYPCRMAVVPGERCAVHADQAIAARKVKV